MIHWLGSTPEYWHTASLAWYKTMLAGILFIWFLIDSSSSLVFGFFLYEHIDTNELLSPCQAGSVDVVEWSAADLAKHELAKGC